MPTAGDEATDGSSAAASVDKSPRRGLSRRRTALLVVLVALIAAGIWTVIAGLVAAHRLRAVRADISRLTKQAGLDRTTLEADLARDLRTVRSANALLGQPGPELVGWLPVVGRNVDATRAVARVSIAALNAGTTLTTATQGLDNGNGGVDLARLSSAANELAAAARQLQAPLDELARQSTSWTLPQVQSGVRQARDQLLGLDDRLARGASGLRGIAGVLGASGPRHILVGLMNNAELRGSGGLLSAYAMGTTTDGRLSLGPFRDVNLVARPPSRAVRVPAPAAYQSAYGPYLANSTLWKNVTMSAQGRDSAQVLAAVAAASLHVHPDVVVLCDVPAAADIISATGPVTIAGQQVSGDVLTRRLLVDAYGNGSLSESQQTKRRNALTSAASQAFARLKHNATSTPDLLQALLHAVNGRHIIVWSDKPAEEQALSAAQVSGGVDATGKDIALAVTNNLGDSPSHGNKLDYYVKRSLAMDVRLQRGMATVTQTLTLQNAAPTGLGPYVEGVRHPGEINELLSMDASAAATLTSFTKDGQPEDVNRDNADGAQRLTTVVQLPRGATTTYRLTYDLPLTDNVYRLLLVPQALAQPADLSLHISVSNAVLGVTSGIDQPVDDQISATGPWTALQDISVPVLPYRGLRRVFHDIAHFWTHKVTL